MLTKKERLLIQKIKSKARSQQRKREIAKKNATRCLTPEQEDYPELPKVQPQTYFSKGIEHGIF